MRCFTILCSAENAMDSVVVEVEVEVEVTPQRIIRHACNGVARKFLYRQWRNKYAVVWQLRKIYQSECGVPLTELEEPLARRGENRWLYTDASQQGRLVRIARIIFAQLELPEDPSDVLEFYRAISRLCGE